MISNYYKIIIYFCFLFNISITETSMEAFILRLFRQENKVNM